MVDQEEATAANPHMSPEEFRRYGHALVDWVARYWQTLGERPVTSPDPAGAVAAARPLRGPRRAEPSAALLAGLDAIVPPRPPHRRPPNSCAYFPANTSGPWVLADLVCAGLGTQGMLWATGPACTELETV